MSQDCAIETSIIDDILAEEYEKERRYCYERAWPNNCKRTCQYYHLCSNGKLVTGKVVRDMGW